ncbi:subtilisin-like serine protease, partial [Weissella oryzae SG25]
MSKKNNIKKMQNSDKKMRHKGYKVNKSWVYAAITSFVGAFGGGLAVHSAAHAEVTNNKHKASVETSTEKVLATQKKATIPSIDSINNTKLENKDTRAVTLKITGRFLDSENNNAPLAADKVTTYSMGDTFQFPLPIDVPGKVIDATRLSFVIDGSELTYSILADIYKSTTGEYPNSIKDLVEFMNSGEIGDLTVQDSSDVEIDYYYHADHSVFEAKNYSMDAGADAQAKFKASDMIQKLVDSTGTAITNFDSVTVDTSDVKWDTKGSYTVKFSYLDVTSGKMLTAEATLTLTSSASESASDSLSDSMSGSDSISDSLSDSVSGSDSISDSVSDSVSGSDSTSDSLSDSISGSDSTSDSLSDSISGSDSTSDSLSDSLSDSDSASDSLSDSISGSDSTSDVISDSESTSDSLSDSISGSDSTSDSLSDSISGSDSTSDSLSDS